MDTKTLSPQKICSRLGLGLVLMMAVWIIATLVLGFVIGLYAPILMDNPWAVWLLNDLPLYLLGLPVLLLVARFIPNSAARAQKRPEVRFGPGKYLILLAFCFGASYALNFAGTLIMEMLRLLLGLPGGFTGALDTASLTESLPAAFIFGVVVPAVGEEFIFRWLIRRKMRGAADRTYIFFSSFCFAIFHMNLVQGMYTFVIGMALAWAYTVTNKLWVPMSIHFVFNFFGIIVSTLVADDFQLALAWSVLVLCLIAAGITLFFVFKTYVFATMRPPQDPAWPYKPARPKTQIRQLKIFGDRYQAVFGRHNHAEWYAWYDWHRMQHPAAPQPGAPAATAAPSGTTSPGPVETAAAGSPPAPQVAAATAAALHHAAAHTAPATGTPLPPAGTAPAPGVLAAPPPAYPAPYPYWLPYGAPAGMPSGYPPPYGYPAAHGAPPAACGHPAYYPPPHPAVRRRVPGAAAACLGNPGMIVYMAVGGLLTIWMTLVMLL